MRDIKVTKNFINSENTSVLYESGNTKVLITVSISDRVPRWLENSDKGWLTAEYNMLPGSSDQRISRKSFEGGRSKEISRLIGRSLRSVCDLGILNGYLITVDCDVLDADGGTRTASINGAWIALNETFNNLVDQKKLVQNPLTNQIAALSVGIVDGDFIADLDYEKYSTMSTDDRRRIIVQTRQTLHDLYKYQEGTEKTELQKFKIKRSHNSLALSLIHI